MRAFCVSTDYRNPARHGVLSLRPVRAGGPVVAAGTLAEKAARLVQALAAVLADGAAATVVQLHLTVGPGVAGVLAVAGIST